jgi:2-keto-4-pentenoate hydratase
MVPAEPGDQVTVNISGLGKVAVGFAERELS